MYKDFTHSADALRRERYRSMYEAKRPSGSGLRTIVGRALLRLGHRLADQRIETTSVREVSV